MAEPGKEEAGAQGSMDVKKTPKGKKKLKAIEKGHEARD